MLAAWNGMTEAQGTVVAALLTIVAAIVGVWLGSRLFGGKVRNLEDAVKQSEDILQAHRTEVEATLAELRQSLTTAIEGIGQLRGAVGEIPTTAPEINQNVDELADWERIRDDWNGIRDELERRAADPSIDGRRRAKYGRIDRRRYYELIDSLDADRNLQGQANDFRVANELWQQFKNGRRAPDQIALQRMADLRRRLIQQVE